MASKSYTLLEYLVTIEMELKKLKKIVAESVGADYSELIANIDGIRNELNTFKTTITDTVDTNNSEITSKFNNLEQQFNTFKTSITNTVNSNKTEITSQVNTLNTNFNDFKTSIESQVSSLNTRVTSVERRVTTLENNQGSSGGSDGGTTKTLIHEYTVTEGTILNITNLETSTGQITTDTDIDLSTVRTKVTPVRKEGVNYLIGSDIPSVLQNANNLDMIDVIDNTFKLKNINTYNITGDFAKYGLLVNGISNYYAQNIFKANKNYEIEVYTSQPYYNTAIRLTRCIANFDYQKGYVISNEQYSTYLAHLVIPNCEGINWIKHKMKLYNYSNSFKLEVETLYDGLNSNTAKYNYKKFEYHYNGNIMTGFDYSHLRNLIPKGTTIKIYEIGEK